MQLTNRVALVTGASRGVGRATALALAARGVDVVIAARTLDPGDRLPGSLSETAAAVADLGGIAHPLVCDLSDPAQVVELAASALDWKGRVDILVNNAAFLGKAAYDNLDEMTLSSWQRQLNVNVTAPMLLSQSLVPSMRSAGGGAIVNLTSAAGDLYEGTVPGIPYGTTKAALNRLTIAIARDLRGDGIAVVAVEPGYVRTAIAEQAAAISNRNIDDAQPPEVPADVIVDLLQRELADVSGKIFGAVEGSSPVLRHDGTGLGPPETRV